MASVKVAVSLPEPLFEQLESAAAQLDRPRSQVIASALQEYLRRRQVNDLRERINRAYADGLDVGERESLEAYRRLHLEVAVRDER
jgi:metal-responsive CopG/Arc/MetJ family transcriptional regulator